MEITSVRLIAINPTSRPQVLQITVQPSLDHIIGRSNFSAGDDTIISRRHARFSINTDLHVERLFVTNLSLINGVLVNFTPVQHFESRTLFDGDEIVSHLFEFPLLMVVFFWSSWIDRED